MNNTKVTALVPMKGNSERVPTKILDYSTENLFVIGF